MPRRNAPPGEPFGADFQLRALVARHGYTNGVVRDIDEMLRATYADIVTQLRGTLTDATRGRLEAFAQFAQERLAEVTTRARSTARQRIAAAGAVEAEAATVHADVLRMLTGLPSRNQIIATARYDTVVDAIQVGGVGFGDWWADTSVKALKRLKATVQQGVLLGTNPNAIAAQIAGTSSRQRTIAGMHLNQWRTAVRSAMTAVQTQAHLDQFREMGDLVQEVTVEAVLDARTSVICRALDNRRYRLDDPNLPKPPLHPNCRTSLVPHIVVIVGGRTIKADDRQTYEEWLKAQSTEAQNNTLGTQQANWWRNGKLSLGEMIANDRSVLTLAQLRERMLATNTPMPIIVQPTPQAAPVARRTRTRTTPAAPAPAAPPVDAVEVQINRANVLLDNLPQLDDDMLDMVGATRIEGRALRQAPFKAGDDHVEMYIEQEGSEAQQAAWHEYMSTARTLRMESLPVQSVNIDGLWRSQPQVHMPTVRQYINSRTTMGTVNSRGEAVDYPVVVRVNGQEWILDGHHRVTAQKLLGQRSIEVRVLDLDKPQAAPVTTASAPAAPQVLLTPREQAQRTIAEHTALQTVQERNVVAAQTALNDARRRANFAGRATTPEVRRARDAYIDAQNEMFRITARIDDATKAIEAIDAAEAAAQKAARKALGLKTKPRIDVPTRVAVDGFSDFTSDDVKTVMEDYFEELDGDEYEIALQMVDMHYSSTTFTAEIKSAVTGKRVASITRSFKTDNGRKIVVHDYFSVLQKAQGGGLSKDTLTGAMRLYRKWGMDGVEVHANIDVGGYAWARYGFKPTSMSEWRALRSSVYRNLQQIDVRERALAEAFLDALPEDPTSVWAVADSKWGKQFLMRTNWMGALDMHDAKQMARWDAYLTRGSK